MLAEERGGALRRRLLRTLRRSILYIIQVTKALFQTSRWFIGGCWRFSWLRRVSDGQNTHSTRPTTRRKLSAVEFLEKFSQGPETESEWNLILWRVTFPMLTLVLFTLLAVLGKFGHMIYSFLVCPVWYFSQLVLVTQPFLLVFKFDDVDHRIRSRIWHILAVMSVAISIMEWYLSAPSSGIPLASLSSAVRARFQHHSWIIANTVFGGLALIAIPRYFYFQRRIGARDTYESLSGSSSAFISLVPSTSGPEGFEETLSIRSTPTPPGSNRGSNTSTGASGPPGSSRGYSSVVVTSLIDEPSQRRSRLVMLCITCGLLVWVAMISSYTSTRGTEANPRYWFTTYLLSPLACVILLYTLRHSTSSRSGFSFEHVVTYSVLIVHLPAFLGHLCFRLFAIVELADPAHPSHAAANGIAHDGTNNFTASTSWMKLGISVLYLIVMQTYFFVMTQVVNAMSEPFAHPTLLYLGQLYYYLFWYVLVGSDTPIDMLYWGMLLVNNVHIAFLNTGFYADVKQSSTGCFSIPTMTTLKLRSSMAMCFRATTMTMISAAQGSDLDGSSSGPYQDDPHGHHGGMSEFDVGLTGDDSPSHTLHRLNRRTTTAAADDSSVSDGNSELDPHNGQATGRRRNSMSMLAASAKSLLSFGGSTTSATIHFSSSSCDRKCSDGSGCGRCSRHSTKSHPRPQRTDTEGSRMPKTSTEQLRPLYFLMKLAEQDNMADTTALILVPSLLTLLAVLDKPSQGFSILADQLNMWVRCICMFIARLGGAYLAREIFTYKLRSRLRLHSSSAREQDVLNTIEGMSTRLWIQKLMLQDFHRQFWYLTIVTIVVTFACFERIELPARFALLT
ncbi:hypothetical protein Poli38472_002602 [Pythium oligandrum]|uniref:Transmembrane protein n=1 Tax=Pythium oligandrum TaxID=41045 RepID=A0A8K1FIB9_PYTOL|nr:hypothetical protein Poli38472_002602 [Pythium oligandrum]|eukprot:TMW63661.1 hypothetical protein Poli38472_002602 [Pythium oligandrum]